MQTALQLVGLADRGKHKPNELSGGQQQRVAIARALVADPTLLVCDEPTGDLDRRSAEEIMNLLQALNRTQGKTIVMVTHDPKAAEYASRELHLDKGRLVDEASENARHEIFRPLIWAGLWRKRARTFFTMASIVVAFLLFGLLQGTEPGLQHRRHESQRRSPVRLGQDQHDRRPADLLRRRASRPCPACARFRTGPISAATSRTRSNAIPAFATDPEPLFQVYREMKIKPEYIEAMKKTRTGVLVSEQLAKQYGWKIGDRIPLGTSIWTTKQGSSTWMFDVVGTFDASAYGAASRRSTSTRTTSRRTASFGGNIAHYYLVGIKDPHQATQISKQIDALFANSTYETRTQTESALAQMQLKQLGDINFIVNAIVGAVLFTLLFLTANTMMQSVSERTPELAVLKTLGFSDGKVLTLVLIEALALCVFAAAIGLALATLAFDSGALQPDLRQFQACR